MGSSQFLLVVWLASALVGSGVLPHVPGPQAALPQLVWAGVLATGGILLADPLTAPGPSPPPRPSAPRAVAGGETCRRNPDARQYLDRDDSYHYFQALQALVVTGPANTNVMDAR